MRLLLVLPFALMPALSAPAQAEEGLTVTVTGSGGTRTLKDTTSHTTLSDGTVVSTSMGKDDKPNGGVRGGGGGGTTEGSGGGASYEGD